VQFFANLDGPIVGSEEARFRPGLRRHFFPNPTHLFPLSKMFCSHGHRRTTFRLSVLTAGLL